MKGSSYKRCSCPPEHDARGRRKACKKAHGSWYYVVDVTGPGGRRRQVKRGGFATQREAQAALAELVDQAAKGEVAHDERQTLAAWLEVWLADKVAKGLRATTAKSYRQHIDGHIVPAIGHVRLRDLRPTHVEQLLAEVAKPKAGRKKAPGPSTVRRVHATLRSALSTAKKRRLIALNPAVDVELPAASRPRVRPWEPGDLGRFLDHAAHDPFGVLFEVMAATGLRRGEALGLRWCDVDLERGILVVRQQAIQFPKPPACETCGQVHAGVRFGRPKTRSGEDRVVDLDQRTTGALLEHRLRQDTGRATWGPAYVDHDLVFAREDGSPTPPDQMSKRFRELVAEAGLRPIRLHDLRHGQASLMLAAGVPIAVVSKRLGHSSIALTSDTYSHLLEGVGRDAAERAAQLVPRAAVVTSEDAAVTTAGDSCDQSVTSRGSEEPSQAAPDGVSAGQAGGPRGARTHNLRIKSPQLCQLS